VAQIVEPRNAETFLMAKRRLKGNIMMDLRKIGYKEVDETGSEWCPT
jgi:hypothetical protein